MEKQLPCGNDRQNSTGECTCKCKCNDKGNGKRDKNGKENRNCNPDPSLREDDNTRDSGSAESWCCLGGGVDADGLGFRERLGVVEGFFESWRGGGSGLGR